MSKNIITMKGNEKGRIRVLQKNQKTKIGKIKHKMSRIEGREGEIRCRNRQTVKVRERKRERNVEK